MSEYLQSKVLEIRYANGFMSIKLKEKGCEVRGRIDNEFAEKAKEVCDEVINGDIEDERFWADSRRSTNHIILGIFSST